MARRSPPGSHTRRGARPRHGYAPTRLQESARSRLRRFRKASALVVALTALVLLLLSAPEGAAQEPGQAVEEATTALADLLAGATALMPKVVIALGVLLIAWLLSRGIHVALARLLANWKRAQATSAMVSVTLWLIALGSAMSVIAGDASALVGSVGLVGLALSWALQGPIESFTGWLLNSFRSYYEIGDRIAVGEVFGDVYKIDLLTTTVWETGGPDKPVQAAQPTGAFVTFPNSEILRANIVNLSRSFPWVWDEVTVPIGEDSEMRATLQVFRRIAVDVLGARMSGPAEAYARLLERAQLPWEVAAEPQVYIAPVETHTEVTIRYLVPVRERRRWSSELYVAVMDEINRPEHKDRIRPAVTRATLEEKPARSPEGT